jgi:Protein of unknown function (DUF1697)
VAIPDNCPPLGRSGNWPSYRDDRILENQRFAMFRFIAFLRAINVGGRPHRQNAVLAPSLRGLGFSRVATFIASWNVVFETTTKKTKTLQRKIERALKEALGYEVLSSKWRVWLVNGLRNTFKKAKA